MSASQISPVLFITAVEHHTPTKEAICLYSHNSGDPGVKTHTTSGRPHAGITASNPVRDIGVVLILLS